MLKIIGIIVVIALVIVLGLAAAKPDTFSLQRATTIHAPPEKVFAYINDFHQWSAWSPWETIDPNMQRTYSGAPKGVGAVYSWSGNSKAGAGRMEIKNIAPPLNAQIALDFTKPFETKNVIEFMLEPQGDSTGVTWVMRGPLPFVSKVMTVFVSMDALVGKDFEAGLVNLKVASEK